MVSTQVLPIDLPLAENPAEKWQPYPLFSGATPILQQMASHVSVLSAHHSPHLPHIHPEEELLIVLRGEADILISDGPWTQDARVEHLKPGSFVYYPRGQHHTIDNTGHEPVTYVMFKWQCATDTPAQPLDTMFFHFNKHLHTESSGDGFAPQLLFDHPTAYLGKLHAHVTELQPGAGYPPHADAYDVAIVVLSGKIKTLDQIIGPCGIIYYSAGQMHGMENVGDAPAKYLVFEFHSLG
jgi:quercetin dioxygenase-like cupin family protein